MDKTILVRTLCSSAGAAIAGPAGGVTGNLVGGLLGTVLPDIADLVSNVVGNLAADAVQSVGQTMAARFTLPDRQVINRDSMFAQISEQIADAVWTLFAEAKTAGSHRPPTGCGAVK